MSDEIAAAPALHDMNAKELLAYGDCLQVDENYEDAIDAYAAALALFRESEAALHIRALSHRSAAFYQLGRYPEALEDAQQALVKMSTQKTAGLYASEGEMVHRRVGMAAFALAKYQDARDIFEKAAQLASLNHRAGVDQFYAGWLQKCEAKMNKPTAAKKAAAPKSVTPMKPSSTSTTTTAAAARPSKAPAAAVVSPKPTSSSTTRAPAVTPHVSRTVMASAPKYQYYQSDKFVTVSILEAQVSEEDLNVRFEPQQLVVTLHKGGKDFTVVAGSLYQEIDVTKSKVTIKDEKVLVRLRKVEEGYEWPELMGKATDSKPAASSSVKKETVADTKDDSSPQKIPTVAKDSSIP
ncbi:MAG: hypothetical protein SGILL_009620, partial [Bacillariaceae sp.]